MKNKQCGWIWAGLLGAILIWSGCVGSSGTQTPRSVISPSSKERFVIESGPHCSLFLDRLASLRFCVPKTAQLETLASNQTEDEAFEVRVRLGPKALAIYVRKDRLPDELPEGALSGRWLRRYAEGYLRRRKADVSRANLRILHPQRAQFFRADDAVWASFPLGNPRQPYVWEETLVLAKKPSTRIVVSLRMGSYEREKQRWELRQLMRLLLRELRLDAALR